MGRAGPVWRGAAGWSTGIAAQALALVAALLPVAFGLGDALVFVVFVSAVASVLVQPLTLAAAVTVPVCRDADVAASQAAWSAICLLLGAVVTFAVTSAVPAASLATATAVTLLVLSQGAFTIYLGVLTRAGRTRSIYGARLRFGLAIAASTLVACVAGGSGLALVGCAAASYVLAGATDVAWLLGGVRRARALRGSRREAREVWGRSWALVLAYSIGSVGMQAPALVAPGLGSLSSGWAAVVRIVAGFQTLGGQVLAPPLDVEMARVVRVGGGGGRAVVRRGFGLGAASAVACVLASWSGAWWVARSESLQVEEWVILLTGGALFAGAAALTAPLGRSLAMTGSRRDVLGVDGVRSAGGGLVLAVVAAPWSVLASSLVFALSGVLYLWLLLRRTSGPSTAPAPQGA